MWIERILSLIKITVLLVAGGTLVLLTIILLGLFIIQIASILFIEHRRPSKALAWMFLLCICPIIGFLLYFFLAKRFSRTVKIKRRSEWLSVRFTNSEWTDDNNVQVWSDGVEFYDALYKAIEKAETYIWFQFYILEDDQSGQRFQEILSRKAQEGVQVKVLYDGLGSYSLSSKYIRQLEDNGIEVYAFLPVISSLFNRQINYRNHRKNVVIDGTTGFMGGFNIGDDYVGASQKLGYWRDTHLELTGSCVVYLHRLFQVDWELATEQRLIQEPPKDRAATVEPVSIQIIASLPSLYFDVIYESYFDAITSARKFIYMETPYFIPDAGIMTALKVAALKGIDVKIIIPSVTDHALVKWAGLSFVEEMLKSGVRMYEYKAGFMHAKVMVIDEGMAIVGSANFDVRSFYENFELNATLKDKKVVGRLMDDFTRDLDKSQEIILAEFKERSRMNKLKESFARMIAPLL